MNNKYDYATQWVKYKDGKKHFILKLVLLQMGVVFDTHIAIDRSWVSEVY